MHLRNRKWLIYRMSSTCRIYPTIRIITHLLHGMQPSPRRSEEAWHVRVVRTVNMVYGDSSTMDVKYPVVWRE